MDKAYLIQAAASIKSEKGAKNIDKKLYGKIRLVDFNKVYRYYGYSSMNQFLIKNKGWSKSSTSERLKIARKYFKPDGTVKDGFGWIDQVYISVLIKLCSYPDEEILGMVKNNYLHQNTTREDITDLHKAYKECKDWTTYLLTSFNGSFTHEPSNSISSKGIERSLLLSNVKNSLDSLSMDKLKKVHAYIEEIKKISNEKI